jgi:hypothetical protein
MKAKMNRFQGILAATCCLAAASAFRNAASNEHQTAIDGFTRLEARAHDNESAELRLQSEDSLYLGNPWYSEGQPEKAVSLLERAAKHHSPARSGNLSIDYYRLTQAYWNLRLSGRSGSCARQIIGIAA